MKKQRVSLKTAKRALTLALALALLLPGTSAPGFAAEPEEQFSAAVPAEGPGDDALHSDLKPLVNDMVYPSEEELLALARHKEILSSINGDFPAADLPDRDNDGFPDDWEINGVDYDGDGVIDLALNTMGADPDVPDVFVEIDWMEGMHDIIRNELVNGIYKPLSQQDYFDITAKDFKDHGINLHIDFGPDSIDYVTKKAWSEYPDSGGNGNALPYYTGYAWNDLNSGASWYTTQLSPSRRPVFHYFALVKSTDEGAGGKAVVSGMYGMINEACAFMHELGHNLGLAHGGRLDGVYDTTNYKANYLSVMNYSICYEFYTYSEWKLPDLDENHLNETQPLDPAGLLDGYVPPIGRTVNYFYRGSSKVAVSAAGLKQPIDYNGNGSAADIDIATDINQDSSLTVLKGTNDWERLTIKNSTTGNTYGTVNTISYASAVSGASNLPGTQTKLWSKSIALSSQIPTHPSYVFQGWSTTNDGPVEYAPGAVYSGRTSVTLYAVWRLKEDEFFLTLDKNLSTASFTGSQAATVGGVVVIPTTLPACSGADKKDFLGWAESTVSTVAQYLPGEELRLTKNTTLYGVWITPVDVAAYATAMLDFVYPNQIRWVHLGIGWSGTNWLFTLQNTTSMPTLYSIVQNTSTSGQSWTSSALSSSSTNLDQSSYASFYAIDPTADYWIKVTALTTNRALISPVLFSIADSTRYLVSFWPNGGAGGPDPVFKENGVTLVLPAQKPERSGYTFLGWSTSATATTASYQAGGNYTSNSATRLFAVWKANVAPAITSAAGTAANFGTAGTFQVTATGDAPITYSLTGAPAGVTINSASGLISIGAAVKAGVHTFTVNAVNGTQPDAAQTFTLTVAKAAGSFGSPAVISVTYTSGMTLASLNSRLPAGYAWVTPATSLSAGNGQSFAATYTDPSGNYSAAGGSIAVHVAKAAGSFGSPAAISATYAPALTLASLNSKLPAGYAWVTPATSLSAGDGQVFAATYTDPSGNYSAANGNITVHVAKAAAPAAGAVTLETLAGAAKTIDYNLAGLLPDVSPGKWGTLSYAVASVANGGGVLASVPPAGPVSSPLRLSVAKVSAGGKTATITLTVTSANYADFNANLIIEIIDKISVTISGVTMDGKTYDGKPCAYTGTPAVMNGAAAVKGITLERLYESTDGGGYSGAAAPVNAGKYKLTLSVPASDADYSGKLEKNFAILKKEIVIKADDKSAKAGSAQPAYSYALSPALVAGDALQKPPAITCPTANMNVPGSYPIVPSGADAGPNYSISYQNGALKILPKSGACDLTGISGVAGTAIQGSAVTGSTTADSWKVSVTVSPGAAWKLYSDAGCTKEITSKTMALAMGANTAYVKVTAEDGVTAKVYTLTITRNAAVLTFSQSSYTVRYRGTQQLSTDGAGVTYTSSNPARVQVDANGKVTSLKAGFGFSKTASATITATDGTATGAAAVQVTMAWWQWLIVIALFGWIWY